MLIMLIAVASPDTSAEFWDDEKPLEINGNPSGYILNGKEKYVNIIGDFNYGISDRLTIGTVLLMDLFLMANINMRVALMHEGDRKPALSLNASGMIALLSGSQFGGYMDMGNESVYSYRLSLGASKSIRPGFCLHGSTGISYMETGNEDFFGYADLLGGDINDIYVGMGTHYKFNKKLMGIGSVNYSFTSVRLQPRISILWAATASFRVLIGVPFIFNLYWQF